LINFQEYFIKNGVKAERGIKNAFTTVTFPNHWTIATGADILVNSKSCK
jgi:hypothetical protein